MSNSPIIDCMVYDTNDETLVLTGNKNVLVRYSSDARARMTATAQGGAAINEDMCIIRNGSETGYGHEHTFYGVSSNVFTFSAEDSEGRVSQKTVVPTMVKYIKLTCNTLDRRPDASGNVELICYGDYFNGSFGAQSNTLTVRCRYRMNGGNLGSYIDMHVSLNGNSYVASATLTLPDYQATYDFLFEADDKLMSEFATSRNITSAPVFHWGKNDVVFEVPVTFKQGMTDVTNPKLSVEAGVWEPRLMGGEPSYTVQNGWYTKIGNIVTIGFYIKATCSSGYEDTDVTIYRLPYTPAMAVAGGGMCSGALILTDKNFQCFVVDVDGTITTRVQACDDTSGVNLETSASGCKYPSGGTLTLSGTLTYVTNNS